MIPSVNGDLFDAERGLENNFEGFYVDDIIIGFAERGEMVTDVTGTVARSSRFLRIQIRLIRPRFWLASISWKSAAEPSTRRPLMISIPTSFTIQSFDTNDRLIEEVFRLGDANRHRDQGQILIADNTIRNTLEYGVRVDAGPRDAAGSLTRPGGVRQLPTLNSQRLVTGVKVENNVVSDFGIGGVLYSGDPNSGTDPLSPVPFGRIMNNTFYGGETARGVGDSGDAER